jgi:hypothetical protein
MMAHLAQVASGRSMPGHSNTPRPLLSDSELALARRVHPGQGLAAVLAHHKPDKNNQKNYKIKNPKNNDECLLTNTLPSAFNFKDALCTNLTPFTSSSYLINKNNNNRKENFASNKVPEKFTKPDLIVRKFNYHARSKYPFFRRAREMVFAPGHRKVVQSKRTTSGTPIVRPIVRNVNFRIVNYDNLARNVVPLFSVEEMACIDGAREVDARASASCASAMHDAPFKNFSCTVAHHFTLNLDMTEAHSGAASRCSAKAQNHTVAVKACDKTGHVPTKTGNKSSHINHPQYLHDLSGGPKLQSDMAMVGSAIAQEPIAATDECNVVTDRSTRNSVVSPNIHYSHPQNS